MAKNTIKRLKKKILRLSDWLVPPNIKNLARIFLKKERDVIFDNRQERRVYRGLHNLPFFDAKSGKPFWGELNNEFRPTVVVRGSCEFSIKGEDPIREIQFGIGVRHKRAIEKIEFFIDGVREGAMYGLERELGPERGEWHDVRIPLATMAHRTTLRIEVADGEEVYISHPLVSIKNLAHAKTEKVRNIVCIVLDGVSREFITETNTPYINAFFRDGFSSSQAFCQGDWTLPAFSSMLTALYPSRHGVYAPRGDVFFRNDIQTLPELLLSHGYRTFGYSSHKRFIPPHGHAKGFERFIYRPINYRDYYPVILNDAIQHLEAHLDESNFLFLHVFDTHPDFEPSGYYKNVKQGSFRHIYKDVKFDLPGVEEHYEDVLSAKLLEVDLALRSLFSYLEEKGLEDTAVILTADHGVTTFAKNKPLLVENRVSIPLLARGASIPKKKEDAFIEGSVDLLPSILSLAGIASPEGISGRAWPFLGGEKRESAFSESLYRDYYQASIRDDSRCFHLKCPFDLESKTISFDKKETVVYERVDGHDKENAELSLPKEVNKKLEEFESYLRAVGDELNIIK